MAFRNSQRISRRKSITVTDMMREAIAHSLPKEEAVVYVLWRLRKNRISKRRLRLLYSELAADLNLP